MLTKTLKASRRVLLACSWLALTASVAAGAFAATSDATTGADPQSETPATFGVLKQPAIPVPAGLMGSSLLDVGAASKVHLALDTVGMRVFVVEAGPDMLCLVVDRASSAMRNCAKRSTEQRDGAIWLAHPKGSGLMEVYGLVRDGVASAAVGGSTADVKNNVFVIADAPVSAETIAVSTKTDQRHVTIGR